MFLAHTSLNTFFLLPLCPCAENDAQHKRCCTMKGPYHTDEQAGCLFSCPGCSKHWFWSGRGHPYFPARFSLLLSALQGYWWCCLSHGLFGINLGVIDRVSSIRRLLRVPLTHHQLLSGNLVRASVAKGLGWEGCI